jgi:DNA transposition AAA+ family ATPase
MKEDEVEQIVSTTKYEIGTEIQQQIERLRRNCVVELKSVQYFHSWLEDKRHCRQACRVVGESQTGKTFACSMYRSKNIPKQSSGDALIVPVIYWKATTNTSQREFFVGLLEQLQYRVKSIRIFDLRNQIYWLLKACQVEMIIVDEAQRLSPKTLSEIQDVLDDLEILVVLVGTDRLDALVGGDEQILRRFSPCYRFQRFDSKSLEEITAIWEKYVLKLPQPSNLTSFSMQKILGASTGGYLGPLDKILRSAARLALQSGKLRIDVSLLSQVVLDHK